MVFRFLSKICLLAVFLQASAYAGEAPAASPHDSVEAISRPPAEAARDPQGKYDASVIPDAMIQLHNSLRGYGQLDPVGEKKPIPDSYSMPTFPRPNTP
jgi:hypothetical protein